MSNIILDTKYDFSAAFNNPDSASDFILQFRDNSEVLHLHKMVLLLNSDYFKSCFKSSMSESKENKITVDDDPVLLTNIIKSLYVGKLCVPSLECIVPMINLTSKYLFIDLENILVKYLLENVRTENAFQIWLLDEKKELYRPLFDKLKNVMGNVKFVLQTLTESSYVGLDDTRFFQVFSEICNDETYNLCMLAIEKWIKCDDNRIRFCFDLIKIANQKSVPNKAPDLSWMDTSDNFKGFKQSSSHPQVFYAVSKSDVWEKDRKYGIPPGFRWMTTAEGIELFKGGSGPYVYYRLGGWSEYVWNNVTRYYFRFKDSNITNACKHAGHCDPYQVAHTEDTSQFAGLVLIRDF